MKKIAIFGQGYVGTQLEESAPQHGARASHNDLENVYKIKTYTKKEHKYHKAEKFIKILNQFKPDYVINACGYTGRPNVDACETDKQNCWNLNVNLPVTMSTICRTYDIPFIHISSGCVYTGYDKHYTEEDPPNFGMGSTVSSWYSKTKHAAEMQLQDAYVFRIRMPFCNNNHERNFLNKVLKYDRLIEYKNSMTSIPDFMRFVWRFIHRMELQNTVDLQQLPGEMTPGIYNVCNPGAISISDVVELFKQNGVSNCNWSFVDMESLSLKANRSNCLLDCSKIDRLGLGLPPAIDSLTTCVQELCKKLLWKTGLQGPKTGLEWQIR